MKALVRAGVIVQTGDIPEVFVRENGEAVVGYHLRVDLHAEDGWVDVVETGPPVLGQDDVVTAVTVQMVAGTPTRTYSVDTSPKLDRQNRRTLEQRLAAGLDTNRAYLAIATPTAAQNTAQIRALTRQTVALIRMLRGQLDGTD